MLIGSFAIAIVVGSIAMVVVVALCILWANASPVDHLPPPVDHLPRPSDADFPLYTGPDLPYW